MTETMVSADASGPMPERPRETPGAVGPLPPDHPEVKRRRVGVLLVNLGTPDAPETAPVRRYLKEFLSDRRVVDYPPAVWQAILNGVILNTRPRKTAAAYRSIWLEDANESPLRHYTRLQAEGVAAAMPGAVVDFAMRYGNPSIASKLEELQDAGCDRILVIPLYPQYSATTTGTVGDAVFDALKTMRWQPAIRIAPAFHDEPAYIRALAEGYRRAVADLASPPEKVVLSFHGLPERYFRAGDPYHCHCQKTARLLREYMGWSEDYAPVTFQSKFGPETWLGPATDATLMRLAEEGVKHAAVMTPGFVADCIETLEELAIAGREDFEAAGGEHLTVVPCINADAEAITLFEALARRETAGWLERAPERAAERV